jgi:hypothetical protein
MSPQVPKARTATTSFVPGLDFAPGEHVCAFYRGVGGRDEVLVPYLTEGLRAGQKCLAVVDESGRDDLLATLAREPGSATAQLDVRTLAIVDLMRTHPKLLLAGMVIENPHYVQPEELVELR